MLTLAEKVLLGLAFGSCEWIQLRLKFVLFLKIRGIGCPELVHWIGETKGPAIMVTVLVIQFRLYGPATA